MSTPYMRKRYPWPGLLLVLFFVLGLSYLSSLVVQAHLPWYHALEKPPYTPPDSVFAIMWPSLYVLMTIAAWLVWDAPVRDKQAVPKARRWFVIQLVLNFGWTPVFFGLESAEYGMWWLAALWLAVGVTVCSFWQVRRMAGWLLVPYWLWVTFAGYLNGGILFLR